MSSGASTTETSKQHPLDASFSHLSIAYHESLPNVTHVKLNRPRKRNAINALMWREIGEAFRQIGTTGDGTRCILLSGSGKGFCGGIDITDEQFFSGISADNGNDDESSIDMARKALAFKPQISQMQAAFTALEECPVPIVAAIHGACIGAGIDMVCCADVRICSSNTVFSIREARLGLAADVGTLQRFPKLVGFGSRVRELCFTGEDFSAEDALKIGFVSRISKSESHLFEEANHIISKIIANSPVAVTVTKSSLNYSRDHTVREGLDHVALTNSAALMSDDLVKSFMMTSGAGGAAEFAPLQPHSRL